MKKEKKTLTQEIILTSKRIHSLDSQLTIFNSFSKIYLENNNK
jgi:hypothetical protein